MIPKYDPKPVMEKFCVGNAVIELDNENRALVVSSDAGDMLFSYSEIPDLVQFLVWAMRTRMEEVSK